MLTPVIVNVVATSELEETLDLGEVSQIEHMIFDQKIYGGRVAYLKKPEMHGKVTIFSTGKLISIGTHSLEEAEADLQETANTIYKAGLIRKIKTKARLRNLVAVLNTKPLSLEEFAFETGAIYEPEQFPAAILKISKPEMTYLIFNSGKIVLVGIKSISDLEESVKVITEIIDSFE